MKCTMHPDIDAAGTCSYSGKPCCGNCLIDVEGRFVAKDNIGPFMRARMGQKELQSSGIDGYASWQNIPWYRKTWVFYFTPLFLIFPLVAFTGGIYYRSKFGSGPIKRISWFGRIGGSIFTAIPMLSLLPDSTNKTLTIRIHHLKS